MLATGGSYHRGLGQMPSLTNPNNVSIVTGVPPSVHGISGNHYRDASARRFGIEEPSQVRAESILSVVQRAGVRVLAITAKDKLRRLLAGDPAAGVELVPSISAEQAQQIGLPAYGLADIQALVGRARPDIYDWDISHYALEIGLTVHRHLGGEDRGRVGVDLGLLYVSLTDYVQHRAPRAERWRERFFRRFDELLGEYLDEGFVVGITADHGMNAKRKTDGSAARSSTSRTCSLQAGRATSATWSCRSPTRTSCITGR